MKRRKYLTAVICLLSCTHLFAQKATINGYVSDKKTGERLLGATIFILNKSQGTTSNAYGFYSITIPKDSVELSFSDNGKGIDLEKRGGQVFGLYKRFHTDIEGKGMGLFMVKTQVETLGGKVGMTSEVNRGTKITLEFDT